jgi:riboflavin synthase
MFSGIVETLVPLVGMTSDGKNVNFEFETELAGELRVDQSIAHNGVCLTVTNIDGNRYSVTAIDETLNLTNLGDLRVGQRVNFERCLKLSDRLDGHLVQGHVDGLGTVERIHHADGSYEFTIAHDLDHRLVLHKGSITINGVSLTVTSSEKGRFSVAIIPHTYEMTNFHSLIVGTQVNLELDVIGKYVQSLMPV